jgi:predicted transcriptional regulator
VHNSNGPSPISTGASSGAGGSGTRRRRRRRSNTRADQAVTLVESNPGITASEVAKQLKIKPNYMYRVMGELQKEGRVRKRGRGYHPAAG